MTKEEYLQKREESIKILLETILKNSRPKNAKDFEILGRAIYEVQSAPVIMEDGSIFNSAFLLKRHSRKMTAADMAANSLIDKAFFEVKIKMSGLPCEL